MARLIIPQWTRLEIPSGRRGFVDAIIPPAEDFLMLIDTEAQTPGEKEFSLALNPAETYDFYVDWGDGSGAQHITSSSPDPSHTYDTAGEYEVSIAGTFPQFYYNNTNPHRQEIIEIKRWGDIQWSSLQNAFYGCSNMAYNPTDAPNLTSVTNARDCFNGCSAFSGALDFSGWSGNGIKDFRNFFTSVGSAGSITSINLTGLVTSAATNIQNMMSQTSGLACDLDLTSWDVQNVIFARSMLINSAVTSLDTTGWNTGSLTSLEEFVRGTSSLGAWIGHENLDTSSVQTMVHMADASLLGANKVLDLSAWDITNLTNATLILSTFNHELKAGTYDTLLVNWDAYGTSGVTLGVAASKYSAGTPATARANMISRGWTITDGGPA